MEVTRLLRKETGGIGRKRLTSGLARLRDVHATLVAGAEAGRWPHLRLLDADAREDARRVAAALRAAAPELVVVGQPGAVAALRAAVEALGTTSPRWMTSPDAAQLAALDRPDVAWLVLEGPPWADRVAEWAVESGRAVAVAGPGDHPAPPSGWWISDPVAGDGRFAPLGAAAAVVASWAGVDIDVLHAGAQEMSATCARSALFENPAYTYALATVFADRDLGAGVPAHLVGAGRLDAFGAWLTRVWAAVLCAAVPGDGTVRHTGAAGIHGIVGDEELCEALLLGPRDKLVTVWDPTELDGSAVSAEAVNQVRALVDLLERENVPYLRVRLPGFNAYSLGASFVLASHAAVTAALFLDLDPLGLDAVAAWYGALDRIRALDAALDAAVTDGVEAAPGNTVER